MGEKEDRLHHLNDDEDISKSDKKMENSIVQSSNVRIQKVIDLNILCSYNKERVQCRRLELPDWQLEKKPEAVSNSVKSNKHWTERLKLHFMVVIISSPPGLLTFYLWCRLHSQFSQFDWQFNFSFSLVFLRFNVHWKLNIFVWI